MKTTTMPAIWPTVTEPIANASVLFLLSIYVFRLALKSTTTYSYFTTTFIALFSLWLAKGEVDILIQRLQRKLPPGRLGFPLIRDILFIASLASTKGGFAQRKKMNESRREYGSMFAQSFIGRIQIALCSCSDLEWIFLNDRRAYTEVAWPPNIVKLLGSGAVANQSGKYHRVLRRLLEPYFAPMFVRNYLTVMDTTTLEELANWSSKGEFISSEVFKMYALRLFYVSSFGTADEAVMTQLHNDFKVWIGGFMSPSAKQIPGTAFAEAMKARDRILHTVNGLIDKFEAENPEESERAQTTIIGRLIYGKDKDDNRMMSRDEMKDNILNLIFAGHDTTYASISTLIHHLTQNPNAMEALAEEVSALTEPLDFDELRNAPVLNACMYESWRMDPPVAGGFRKAVNDIEHKGYKFKPGTVFNYSVLMATSDETQYKNHDVFQMERFLPKDHPLYNPDVNSGIDPSQGRASYPIFGGGTHVCLGKAFAQLELRVIAARMLKHYHVEVRNAQKAFFPVNGWNVEFKLTERKSS